MKHILPVLTATLALMATTAFAAFNYEVSWTPYENDNGEGNTGRYFTVKFSGGSGKVYITDLLNTVQSTDQSEILSAPGMGVTRYGYYYLNNPDDTALHDFALNDPTVEDQVKQFDYFEYNTWKKNQGLPADRYYRNGYLLGEFKDGDEIEIYMTDGDVEVRSNTPVVDGEERHISNYDVRKDKLDPNMKVASLYLGSNPLYGTQVNFGIAVVASDASGDGNGGTDTVGSPLPGGLQIALIAGLFGLGFWFVRRRKKAAA